MNKRISQTLSIIILSTSIPAIIYRFLEAESLYAKLNLLGYFTIQSNLIVIILIILSLLSIPVSRKWELIVAVSITITALIFQLFLKSELNIEGLKIIVSNINHGSTTLLFILWYWLSPGEKFLDIKQIWVIIPYPVIYCIYGVFEGFVRNESRYFFLDVQKIGWTRFGVWFIALALMFLMAGFILLTVDKLIRKST